MSRFRVKVDLSNFYNDNRKYAYVSINPEWNIVQCLQKHVENLFNLPRIELLTEDSCYLPPLEDIGIVKQGDVLQVLADTNDNKLDCKSHKKQKKSKVLINEEEETHKQAENYEPPSKRLKKIKCDLKICEQPKVKESNNDNIITDTKLSVKKLKRIFDNKFKEINIPLPCDQLSEDSNTSFNSETQKCKKKRKRVRKKKSKKEIEPLPIDVLKKCIALEPEIPKSVLAHTKSVAHIRFDDNGNAFTEKEKEISKPSLVFKNHLDILNKLQPRIVTATIMGKCSQNEHNRNIHQIEETIQPPNLEISTEYSSADKKIDHVEILDQRESNSKENSIITQSGKICNFKCADILEFAEPLERDPVDGDILLFKIHRLNEKYEPTLSNYICGKFEGIEESTNFLKIFLIDGQDQLQDPKGKFSLGLQNESSDYLFLKCEDLIDKKIFKM